MQSQAAASASGGATVAKAPAQETASTVGGDDDDFFDSTDTAAAMAAAAAAAAAVTAESTDSRDALEWARRTAADGDEEDSLASTLVAGTTARTALSWGTHGKRERAQIFGSLDGRVADHDR